MGLAGLVHWTAAPAPVAAQREKGKGRPRIAPSEPPAVIRGRGIDGLPPAVLDMRAAIIAAVETGDITELKGAMDLNELKPELGGPAGVDPIAHLRSLSADGSGKDVLAEIGKLLEGSWAAIPGGRDIENNRIYVWPQLAEIPLGELSGAENAELVALVGENKARAIVSSRRWQGWRLSIGSDGVWHTLIRVEP